MVKNSFGTDCTDGHGKAKDFFTTRFARDTEDAEGNLLLKNREMPIFQKNLAAFGGFMAVLCGFDL